jgi:hypothetical protein
MDVDSRDGAAGDQPDYMAALNQGDRRRGHRQLFLGIAGALAVVALIAVAGYQVYQAYVSSPQYSLRLLERAVREGDPVGISRHYDSRRVAEDLYEAAADDLARGAIGEDYAWLVKGLAGLAAPPFVDYVAVELDRVVLEDPMAGANGLYPQDERASLEVRDAVAVASVSSPDGDTIRFIMMKASDYWRVVGVENAPDVYEELLDATGIVIPDTGILP